MANHPIVLQGKTNDYNRNPVFRKDQNFDPGRGRSLQTIALLALRNRQPLPNSINKFLFLSKKKNEDGQTYRNILKVYLAEQDKKNDGFVHEDTEEAINFLVNQKLKSQKPGYNVAVRPLFSYSEKNGGYKRCKYGAYKDGSRHRCVQNLNHKKGGGGDVTAQESEERDDGEPDERTKTQRWRKVIAPPYVRKRPIRRADQEDTQPQDEEEDDEEPTFPQPPPTTQAKAKASSSRELKRLAPYLNDPKTAPTSGKRKRKK